MIVVIGATGHVGSQVADFILSRGKQVRVISRSTEKLVSLRSRGAYAFVGDILDTDFLVNAFKGATAVFSMIPPNPKAEHTREYQNIAGESIAAALKKTGITHVVNLSSVGADLNDNTGLIKGLHDHEERLNKIKDLNVVHLRAAYFMENSFGNIGLIREKHIFGGPIRADLPMSVIAAKDIAEAAAELLMNPVFSGKSVRYLLGQRDLTMNEMTDILGKAIGKPGMPYVHFKYEDAEKAMIGMGMPKDLAGSYIEMARAFNDGIIRRVERTPDNTTSTAFEEFSDIFVDYYCFENIECRVS